jgi:hypothetical protein
MKEEGDFWKNAVHFAAGKGNKKLELHLGHVADPRAKEVNGKTL